MSSVIITIVDNPTHGTAVQNGSAVEYHQTDSDPGNVADSFTYTVTDADGLTSSLALISISANGGANGIVLQDTTGSFTVTGDGNTSVGGNNSGGTIQNTSSHGISLSNATNLSFTNLNIQTTGGSGINGTQVTNFSFTNGTINNSGDALGESNIAFNGNGTLMGNNLNGTLTLTNSILTNAFDHGIHVENNDGTISNAIITGNTITSSTSTATSKGSGIQMIGTGNASTVSNLTRATISRNTVRNFPSGAGIQVSYGNANATGPGGNAGIPGDATNIITITNNVARGNSAANRFGTHAIIFAISGGNSGSRSRGNFNVSNNGTVGNPIGDSLGIALGVGNNGYATMTATVNNNVIVANNTVASGGISGGNGVVIGNETPDLTLTVSGNNISQTDGNGIILVGRGASGIARLTIENNTVAAPLTGIRPGIRIDAGNNASGNDAVCLSISGNTSAGSGGSQGIGLRKQGTGSTMNDFGVVGMAATSSPGVEAYVDGLNPAGGGTLLISATSGFSNCTIPLLAEGGQALTATSIDALPQTPLVAAEAAALWASTGISAEQQAQLAALGIAIADLPDGVLGYAYPDHLELDATAAGYGWFVDATPDDSSEFALAEVPFERRALPGSPAYGRMDLLTAIQHEYGHVLGLDHAPTDDHPVALMADTLPTGTRRLPVTQSGSAPPDNQRFKPAAAPAASLNSFPVNVGTLPAGKSVTIVFDVVIGSPFPAGADQISNQGTVTFDDALATGQLVLTDDPNDATGSADPTITPIDAQIALALAKSDGGASVVPGSTVTYTLTYRNDGNQTASGVMLTETVPANTSVDPASVTAGWVCAPDTSAGATCNYSVGTLAGGSGDQTVDFILVLSAAVGDAVTEISNAASIDDDNTSGEDGFASASDTTPIVAAPVLTASKTVTDVNGGIVVPGDLLEYQITVLNTGNRDGVNVRLTDPIPANTTYVDGSLVVSSGSPGDDSGAFDGTAINAGFGALLAQNPGDTGTVTFRVQVVDPYPDGADTTISNQATVSADNAANALSDDPGTVAPNDPTQVTVIAGLTISKAFVNNNLRFVDTTSLRFTLVNPAGLPALTNLSFSDDLPLGLAFLPPLTNPQCGGTLALTDADSLTFTGGALPAGLSQCVIDVGIQTTGAATGLLENVSSRVTSDEGISSSGRARATVFVAEQGGGGEPGGGGQTSNAPPLDLSGNFLCANLMSLTNGALVGLGGIGNVQGNGQTGNTYCHVINMDGQYLVDSAQIGNLDLI